MQRVRDPFSQALIAIRKRVRSGCYVGGERLAIADLADELALSATPVREALARLAGEGLIEERRGQGYFAWRLDVVDLLELYELQELYLRAAVERWQGAPATLASPSGEPALWAEDLFAQIVLQAANATLARANRLIADRLAAPRRAEGVVIGQAGDDLQEVLAAQDAERLLGALGAYHARRAAAGPQIISALRSLSERAAI